MAEWTDLKPLGIPCLMGIQQLQKVSESQGVRMGDSTRKYLVYLVLKTLGSHHVQKLISKFVADGLFSWKDDLYEVEEIVDHCEDEDTGEIYYLIKWEGWRSEHNSWEPRSNLQCDDMIQEYTVHNTNHNRASIKRKYKDIAKDTNQSKTLVVDQLFDKLSSSNALTTLTPMDILKFYSPAKRVKKMEPLMGVSSASSDQQKRPIFRIKKKVTKKLKMADIAEALKDWERQMNSITNGIDTAPLTVVNDVDLEGPPDTFVYINQCKEGPGVVIPNDPLVGCECEDCFKSKNTCCAACSGTDFAYYKGGRVRVEPGRPVYECNNRCKCGPDCVNRVVQKGRRFKICIFRTKNGRGWGVKTLQLIKKGSFVMEYVGEVITHEEAERRGKEYDAAGRTYLFDLDFADTNNSFTVDAGYYGNAAHFINHSCDPNMEVYCVWINCLDPRLPHICLFAKRDIQKNEELTFDYLCSRTTDVDDGEVSFNLPDTSAIPLPTVQPDVDNNQSESGDNVAVGETGDGFSVKGISISPKDKSSSTVVNTYSSICQCGAAKCRKYLF